VPTLKIHKRDTLLTIRRRSTYTNDASFFLGYITDNSGNHFVDNAGNKITNITPGKSNSYRIRQRDTLLVRRKRNG
jgi:hypothetical protein